MFNKLFQSRELGILGAHLAHARKHVALQEVGLNPVPEVIQEINHAQVVAHTLKAAMVRNH